MARSDPVVRSCPACRVEVSVPEHFVDPRCPQCKGPLGTASQAASRAHLDETAETLLEVRSDSGDEQPAALETLRDFKPPESVSELQAVELDDTATFPGAGSGESLGPYELVRILGKGGMGVVYEAHHAELGRTVALKVMRSSDAGREELERFKREARAAAKLRHANIVPILEVGEHDGQHYFTMTMVEGQTLTSLARSGQIEPNEAARLMADVARAIHYAHEQGVIHRDLKPSNVIVDAEGVPYVMDFGLAKDLSDNSGLTLTGIAMGSPPYMPPEQARGEFRKVDAISDVYGLGATLYECLVGRPPFGGKSLYDVIAKVLAEDPESPRSKNPEIPYDLETVCLKALEKEKWRRYPTALDLARDLDRFIQGQSIRAVRQGLTTRVGRVIARHRLQIFSMLIPIAVATALGAYAFGSVKAQALPARAQRVISEKEATPGPLSEATRYLSTARGGRALESLVESFGAEGVPLANVGATAIQDLSDRSPGLRDAFENLERARGKATPGLLAEAGLELVKAAGGPGRREVTLGDLGRVSRAWFNEIDAELFRRALATLRASDTGSKEAWESALSGEAGVLDGAIARVLSRSISEGKTTSEILIPPGRLPSDELRLRYVPPHRSGEADAEGGRVEGTPRSGVKPWTYPPYRLREAEEGKRPLLTGLQRSEAPHDLSPTAPVLSSDGRRVAVGWLRFVLVLDAASGEVLARRRLPGLAQGLDQAPDGGYRLDLWCWPAREFMKPEVVEGCSLSADLSVLLDDEGKPFPPQMFLARGSGLRDQLWREACALAPEFDGRIELVVPGGRKERLFLDLYPPARQVMDLRFEQGAKVGQRGGRRVVLADPSQPSAPHEAIVREATMGKVGKRILKEKALLEMEPIDLIEGPVKSLRPGLRLKARPSTGGRTRAYHYEPFREPEAEEWAQLAQGIEAPRRDLLAGANPWTLAFLAAARARAAEGGQGEAFQLEELTGTAARSPHLDPRGRVELACFLDRHGFEAAADEALELALRESWAAGFLPTWAGYGELDAGRLLADRVEECLVVERRAKRATALARWRDALAPTLRDSSLARAGYRWRGGKYEAAKAQSRAPPALPEALARRAPTKGVAGLGVRTVVRVDHALRLKTWFFVALMALMAISIRRYSRHAKRDLERIGKTDGWARFKMWFERPAARARFAWPTYLTLSDKVALVALYLAFFGVFAVAEAGVEILLAIRSAPPALLAGLADEPEANHYLESAAQRSSGALYAAAYRRLARGEELGKFAGPLASLGETEPRALLLWAEAAEPGAARSAALAKLAGELPGDDLLRLELLRAREAQDAGQIASLEAQLVQKDVTFAGWVWARGRSARDGAHVPRQLPVSPAPTVADRDEILVGSTHWAKRLPEAWLLNMLAQPPAEDRERQLAVLRQQHSGIGLARFHNSWFFLIPTTLVLLVASLFMPQVHPFEPLESDLKPSLPVKVLRLLIPGVTQHQRNRPLRGMFLVISAAYLMSALLDHYFHRGFALAGASNSLTGNLTSIETAHFTGEVTSSLAVVQATHGVELILALITVYALHWLDLYFSQRKVYQAESRPDSEAPYVIPVDSESALPAVVASGESNTKKRSDAPFEATELDPEGRSGGATALDRLELPPSPLEKTELGLERRPTSDSGQLERTELGAQRRPTSDTGSGDLPLDKTELGIDPPAGPDDGDSSR
jgi:protein kinase-like protein